MPRTSTKTARDGAYSLDDQIGFLLRRVYQRASANLLERIRAHDLTPPQFATLARLHECGRLSQNRLGRLAAMEPANIRDVVQRLKTRRLVDIGRDATDGRRILIGLTPAGAALIACLLPVEIACTAKTLAPLAPGARIQLYRLLLRLAD